METVSRARDDVRANAGCALSLARRGGNRSWREKPVISDQHNERGSEAEGRNKEERRIVENRKDKGKFRRDIIECESRAQGARER